MKSTICAVKNMIAVLQQKGMKSRPYHKEKDGKGYYLYYYQVSYSVKVLIFQLVCYVTSSVLLTSGPHSLT